MSVLLGSSRCFDFVFVYSFSQFVWFQKRFKENRDANPLLSKIKASLLFQNTSPDDLEKKRTNSSAYRSYLNREGPRALGSKDIPQVKKT